MKVVVLFNPSAGRGRGTRVAASIEAMLKRLGHEPTSIPVGRAPGPSSSLSTPAPTLDEVLADSQLLLIAGGDGTLHHSLPAVLRHNVPIYHIALGTENLFARQFGMTQLPETLDRAIARWQIQEVDVGLAQVHSTEAIPVPPSATQDFPLRTQDSARTQDSPPSPMPNAQSPMPSPFLLMCSFGPDASVIRRLHLARTGPISHLSYLRPVLQELADPRLPCLSIQVDGKTIVDNRRGMVIIANSSQYGARIDPASRASMSDGLLDVVFFPTESGPAAGMWFLRSRLRRDVCAAGAVYQQGKHITITTDDPDPVFQIDGECGRVEKQGAGLRMEVSLREKAVKVLVP